MKTAQHTSTKTLWLLLAASATMNLTGLAWGLHQYFRGTPHEAVSAAPASVSVADVSQPVPEASHPEGGRSASPPPPKFQWQNLEAESYDTFIARLREIGCPENTIKDIVAGELKAKSADRRAELERKILRSSDWSPPRGVSRQEYLASQLRKLDRENEMAADNLLQSSAAPALASSSSASSSVAASSQENNQPPVRYPVVMDDVSFQSSSTGEMGYVAPGVVETSQEQLASIQEIQQKFVQDVGGLNQDVEDPQYEEIWRTAQWKADQIFRARHGIGAHNDLQRAAAQKAYEQQRKAAAAQ